MMDALKTLNYKFGINSRNNNAQISLLNAGTEWNAKHTINSFFFSSTTF